MDETYAPLAEKSESFTTPHLRQPLPCAYCLLEETPYIISIRTVLKEALNRPTSVLHKEKFLCFNFCLEQLAAPIFVVMANICYTDCLRNIQLMKLYFG